MAALARDVAESTGASLVARLRASLGEDRYAEYVRPENLQWIQDAISSAASTLGPIVEKHVKDSRVADERLRLDLSRPETHLQILAILANIPLSVASPVEATIEQIRMRLDSAKIKDPDPAIRVALARLVNELTAYKRACMDPTIDRYSQQLAERGSSIQSAFSLVTFQTMFAHPIWTRLPLSTRRAIPLLVFGKDGLARAADTDGHASAGAADDGSRATVQVFSAEDRARFEQVCRLTPEAVMRLVLEASTVTQARAFVECSLGQAITANDTACKEDPELKKLVEGQRNILTEVVYHPSAVVMKDAYFCSACMAPGSEVKGFAEAVKVIHARRSEPQIGAFLKTAPPHADDIYVAAGVSALMTVFYQNAIAKFRTLEALVKRLDSDWIVVQGRHLRARYGATLEALETEQKKVAEKRAEETSRGYKLAPSRTLAVYKMAFLVHHEHETGMRPDAPSRAHLAELDAKCVSECTRALQPVAVHIEAYCKEVHGVCQQFLHPLDRHRILIWINLLMKPLENKHNECLDALPRIPLASQAEYVSQSLKQMGNIVLAVARLSGEKKQMGEHLVMHDLTAYTNKITRQGQQWMIRDFIEAEELLSRMLYWVGVA